MRAILVPADHDVPLSEVEVEDFRDMARVIGADYIERVRIGDWSNPQQPQPFTSLSGDTVVMVVDEHGALTPRKPINSRAAWFYGNIVHGGLIFGDVLLVGEGEIISDEGYPEIDFIGLPLEYHVAVFETLLQRAGRGYI